MGQKNQFKQSSLPAHETEFSTPHIVATPIKSPSHCVSSSTTINDLATHKFSRHHYQVPILDVVTIDYYLLMPFVSLREEEGDVRDEKENERRENSQ